ncbi:MAG: NAD-dependent epimerase/dehydratase family protein [Clostridia bacterium]|nr:NAD-dependent epimerase/dehydratase family protein [Clostridia bacterium]
MNCVVTGANGHIGNVLVRDLLKRGYHVKCFILPNTKMPDDLDVEIAFGDVRDIESLKRAFQGADVVFHLAGMIEIGSGNKKRVYDVNVNGSKNVVLACKEMKVRKLVYTSSVHAIEEKPKNEVIGETKIFDPKLVKGTYAKTKAEATKYILEANSDELEVIIVHPSGVIGPYEYEISNLGQLIIDCAKGRIGAYLSGGYNFVDVRDVSSGIILAFEKGRAGECYILAGDVISVRELMLHIEKITGVKAPKFKIARWFAYITGVFSELYSKIVREKPLFTSYAVYTLGTNAHFSISKAKKELGYTIRGIDDTLKDTIKWYRERGEI